MAGLTHSIKVQLPCERVNSFNKSPTTVWKREKNLQFVETNAKKNSNL